MNSQRTTPERTTITSVKRIITPVRRSRFPADDQDRSNPYLRLKETQLIRQCCECGGFKLYALKSPSTTCRTQSCNESHPLDHSEPRAWELCTHCGPTACNKILGLTRTHNEIEHLYLLRCCWCRTENVCRNQTCAQCGNKGCCQCDIIHDITEAHSPNLGRVIASVQNGITTPNCQRLSPRLKNQDFLATRSKGDSKNFSAVKFEVGPVLHATQLGDITQLEFLFYPYISSSNSQINPGSTEAYQTVEKAVAAAHCLRLVETHPLLQHLTAMKKPKRPTVKKDVIIGRFEKPDEILQRELDEEKAEFLSPVANLPQLLQHDSSETLKSPAIQEPTLDNESVEEEFLRTFGPFSSDIERELHISRDELLRPFVTISGELDSLGLPQSSNTGNMAQHSLGENDMLPQNEVDMDTFKEVSEDSGPRRVYIPLSDSSQQDRARKTTEQTIGGDKAVEDTEGEARNCKRKRMVDAESLNFANSNSVRDFEFSNAFPKSHPRKIAKLSNPNSRAPAAEVEVDSRKGELTDDSNPSFDSYYQDFTFLSSPSPELQAQSDDTEPDARGAEIEAVPLNEMENNLAWFPEIG